MHIPTTYVKAAFSGSDYVRIALDSDVKTVAALKKAVLNEVSDTPIVSGDIFDLRAGGRTLSGIGFDSSSLSAPLEIVMNERAVFFAQQVLKRSGTEATFDGLRDAVEAGDADLCELFIAAGMGRALREKTELVSLVSAVQSGSLSTVEVLVRAGSPLEHTDERGRTALMHSAQCGHASISDLLIRSGAQINNIDCDGHSALTLAARSPNADTAEYITASLIQAGADLECTASYATCEKREVTLTQTSLLVAAARGSGFERVVQTLIEAGANINTSTVENGRTALMYAAHHNQPCLVEYLISHGANVNSLDNGGYCALLVAGAKGNALIMESLILSGADLEVPTRDGRTALSYAAAHGLGRIVGLLVGRGAKMECSDKKGTTPLLAAAERGHAECVEQLVVAGADVDARGGDCRTALFHCARNGLPATSVLIRHGADVNGVDKFGFTPLLAAAEKFVNGDGVAMMLIDAGADVDASSWGNFKTALMFACQHGKTAVVKKLIARGANLDRTDMWGCTALTIAAKYGHEGAVLALIDAGADVTIASKKGVDPLMYASRAGFTTVVEALIARGASAEAMDDSGYSALLLAANCSIAQMLVTPCPVPFGASGYNVRVQHRFGRQATYNHTAALQTGVPIVVCGDRGRDIGIVLKCVVCTGKPGPCSGKVDREASATEVASWRKGMNAEETRAMRWIKTMLNKHDVPISVAHAEFQYDKAKLTFHYTTSAGHPDFKILAKLGFRQFRCKIWMHRIGTQMKDASVSPPGLLSAAASSAATVSAASSPSPSWGEASVNSSLSSVSTPSEGSSSGAMC